MDLCYYRDGPRGSYGVLTNWRLDRGTSSEALACTCLANDSLANSTLVVEVPIKEVRCNLFSYVCYENSGIFKCFVDDMVSLFLKGFV